MTDLFEFIINEAIIVIPVLWVIGMFIKNTPKMKDWAIPYILLVIGVALTVGIMGVSVDAIIQGVLVSGAAVYGHQLIKQSKKGDE